MHRGLQARVGNELRPQGSPAPHWVTAQPLVRVPVPHSPLGQQPPRTSDPSPPGQPAQPSGEQGRSPWGWNGPQAGGLVSNPAKSRLISQPRSENFHLHTRATRGCSRNRAVLPTPSAACGGQDPARSLGRGRRSWGLGLHGSLNSAPPHPGPAEEEGFGPYALLLLTPSWCGGDGDPHSPTRPQLLHLHPRTDPPQHPDTCLRTAGTLVWANSAARRALGDPWLATWVPARTWLRARPHPRQT